MIESFFTTINDENIAYHVTNDKNDVNKARENLAIKYNYNASKLCYMNQTHSNKVQIVNDIDTLYDSDAIVTNKKNTPLMVMVADCIPILFFDTTNNVIAAAHAGREGTFRNISQNTITTMINQFHCKPENIKVIMGPSIQKCCYEVSQDMANEAIDIFGKEFVDKRNLNLQAINKKQLINLGIKEKKITQSTVCTKCSNQAYFSYRKDSSCGRFSGVIVIKEK